MPRLFVATGIFHPEPGGPATYLHELLPALQARGWEVRLLTYGSGPTDSYPYPVMRVPRRALLLRLADYARAARPLLRWADLTYVHTLGLPLLGGGGPRVFKIVGDQAWERAIRRGWVAPTTDVDAFQNMRGGLLVTLQQAARSREVRGAASVIVPSEYLKRMVVGWGVNPARVQVIYNALPADNAGLALTQAEARQRLGLDTAAPLVFTAARLTPWKGVDHLIAAVRRVPDVRLLVAGDGESLLDLQRLAAGEPRVTFLGRLAREQVTLYMRAADYFALYSGYEGLSHVLLESLRAGTPVIASDKGGNPEVVVHGVNGLLVPYVNVDVLAAALVEAFRPGVRAALAANADRGLARFAFDTMVEQTHAALLAHLR